MEWLSIPLAQLETDGRTLVQHDGHAIALFRVNDEIHAIENTCPHEGNPLVEGEVLGGNLTCAYHGWTFDLATGSCLVGEEPVRRYPVEVRNGLIRIGFES
jgi:nitrite reductase/ring-hydroxylating ferredoxin subunit